MVKALNIRIAESIALLKQLIATPSFSREENNTATIIENFFTKHQVASERIGNNVIVRSKNFGDGKPVLLLNSHHDTVKPNSNYTVDPFGALEQHGKIFGLGSNDAGASLVSLAAAFLHFYEDEQLPVNLLFVASAEEEISGANGIESVLAHIGKIDMAIVGEPTEMEMAVSEMGLMVLDCLITGVPGHAARNEGVNAIYKALPIIHWFETFQLPGTSKFLPASKMTITSIETENKAHNVVPGSCNFVVDVRVNDALTLQEILDEIKKGVDCQVTPRSLRLKPTSIAENHPLVVAGLAISKKMYGSPTLSDKALMPFPALKMGPGKSERSHTADEFIYLSEIEDGIKDYIEIIKRLK